MIRINNKAIRLGELAEKNGDYKRAIKYYSKALNRVRDYPGDSMHPIMLASGLEDKICDLTKKIKSEPDSTTSIHNCNILTSLTLKMKNLFKMK